jgi:hypothetical protein
MCSQTKTWAWLDGARIGFGNQLSGIASLVTRIRPIQTTDGESFNRFEPVPQMKHISVNLTDRTGKLALESSGARGGMNLESLSIVASDAIPCKQHGVRAFITWFLVGRTNCHFHLLGTFVKRFLLLIETGDSRERHNALYRRNRGIGVFR